MFKTFMIGAGMLIWFVPAGCALDARSTEAGMSESDGQTRARVKAVTFHVMGMKKTKSGAT